MGDDTTGSGTRGRVEMGGGTEVSSWMEVVTTGVCKSWEALAAGLCSGIRFAGVWKSGGVVTWKSGVLGTDSGGSRRSVSGVLDKDAVAGVVTMVAGRDPWMAKIDLTGAVSGNELASLGGRGLSRSCGLRQGLYLPISGEVVSQVKPVHSVMRDGRLPQVESLGIYVLDDRVHLAEDPAATSA